MIAKSSYYLAAIADLISYRSHFLLKRHLYKNVCNVQKKLGILLSKKTYFLREAVVTQQSSEGEEVEVGVLGAEDYFGEIALLFDK